MSKRKRRQRLQFTCIETGVESPGEGGGGVLRILSDGDDQRIFLGLKFSIPGFFCVREFGKYFLCVCVARFKQGFLWAFKTISSFLVLLTA